MSASKKVAVAVIHGIGRQEPTFAQKMIDVMLPLCGQAEESCVEHIVFQPVYWAPVFNDAEQTLFERTKAGGPLDYLWLREVAVHLIGDAIAYQPTSHNHWAYSEVHAVFAHALRKLAEKAGDDAPLVIIAHSLGTVIASNYIYDMQADDDANLPDAVRQILYAYNTPLERCRTLAQLFTLGSPLALWSLRYKDFDNPIHVPSPQLAGCHPGLWAHTGWWNMYDRDDVVGYPLKMLNDAYYQAVTADIEVNVGNIQHSWNPASHMAYWTDDDVIRPIANRIAGLWRDLNARLDTDPHGKGAIPIDAQP